jgi:proteic killer suppression protein
MQDVLLDRTYWGNYDSKPQNRKVFAGSASLSIKSFGCAETEKLFSDERGTTIPNQIVKRARVKLLMIDAATKVSDLRVPTGNRLEKLSSTRSGQFSIRINDQYRVCFVFRNGDAFQVEIVDYH